MPWWRVAGLGHWYFEIAPSEENAATETSYPETIQWIVVVSCESGGKMAMMHRNSLVRPSIFNFPEKSSANSVDEDQKVRGKRLVAPSGECTKKAEDPVPGTSRATSA